MGKDGEGDKKEVKGWKGRGKELPDQCQAASYAPGCNNTMVSFSHDTSLVHVHTIFSHLCKRLSSVVKFYCYVYTFVCTFNIISIVKVG